MGNFVFCGVNCASIWFAMTSELCASGGSRGDTSIFWAKSLKSSKVFSLCCRMEVMCISALLLHSPAIARWRKPSVDTPKCKCFGIKLTDKADKSTDKFFVEVSSEYEIACFSYCCLILKMIVNKIQSKTC